MPAVYAALLHSPWTIHFEPSEKVTDGTLNVHEHLSPFSAPFVSYQAPGFAGSDRASLSSWALTFASAATPWL